MGLGSGVWGLGLSTKPRPLFWTCTLHVANQNSGLQQVVIQLSKMGSRRLQIFQQEIGRRVEPEDRLAVGRTDGELSSDSRRQNVNRSRTARRLPRGEDVTSDTQLCLDVRPRHFWKDVRT